MKDRGMKISRNLKKNVYILWFNEDGNMDGNLAGLGCGDDA